MGVGSQRHSPAALPRGRRPGTHCIGGWMGPRAGLDGCGKTRPPTGIRSPDRPARSESLYRLSCPGPCSAYMIWRVGGIFESTWHAGSSSYVPFTNCPPKDIHKQTAESSCWPNSDDEAGQKLNSLESEPGFRVWHIDRNRSSLQKRARPYVSARHPLNGFPRSSMLGDLLRE